MDKLYSIAECAEILGVTKQCVYKKLETIKRDIKPFLTFKQGVKYIAPEGIELIKQSIKPVQQPSTCLNGELKQNVENVEISKFLNDYTKLNDNLIRHYENTIDYLKKEVEEKNRIINGLLNSSEEQVRAFQILLKENQDKILYLEEKQQKKKWWSRNR